MKRVHFALIVVASVTLLTATAAVLFDANWSTQAIPADSIEQEYLTYEEYLTIRDEFLAIVDEQDPRAALLAVDKRGQTNSQIANVCHQITHDIGQRAYEKYQDFGEAMQYTEIVCNVGYIHGVTETHFSNIDNIRSEVESTCSEHSLDTVIGWECRHGIGHGLMFATDNNLPLSLEECDRFPEESSRHACHTGVFMENFNTNEAFHPSEFLDTTNPFAVCKTLDETYYRSCNHYAAHYLIRSLENDFETALTKCEDLPSAARIYCGAGVGDLAIKEHINRPHDVERICMTAKTNAVAQGCIHGMTALFVNQNGSITAGQSLCASLQEPNQPTCEQVLDAVPEGYYET